MGVVADTGQVRVLVSGDRGFWARGAGSESGLVPSGRVCFTPESSRSPDMMLRGCY